MLTLKKVKELVGAPSHAKRTPSPKMLYEEGIVLLRREFDQGSHLTVYNSGYVLFSAGKRNTVFHIHDCCGDYAYDAAEGKGDVIEEEYFENCEWHIRALFEGERKMEDNQAKCEGAGRSNVCVSYHALSEDWSEIADRTINMLEKIIENKQKAKSYAQQIEDGFLIHHQNYQSAYKGQVGPSETPVTVRGRLEEQRPNTFIGRPFGVSDVMVWDEEEKRKFFYVDKDELVEFGGFTDIDSAGNVVALMVPNYQVDGKTGTWLPYDSEVVEGVCFFMMRNEQRRDAVSPIVVDSKGVFVTEAPNGFENVRATITEYVRRAERKQQDVTEHEKCLTNGTYERARESGTEQNYNMIDGCVNNNPKKPRVIGNRVSVLDRLHIKLENRKQKEQGQQQQQERTLKN